MNDQHNGNMMAVKLPTQYVTFVRNNPKLAQVVGNLIVESFTLKQRLTHVDALLSDSKNFESLLEHGTSEDIQGFLEVIKVSKETAMDVGEVNEEVVHKLQEEMGDLMVATILE